jgi:hypothetical protein
LVIPDSSEILLSFPLLSSLLLSLIFPFLFCLSTRFGKIMCLPVNTGLFSLPVDISGNYFIYACLVITFITTRSSSICNEDSYTIQFDGGILLGVYSFSSLSIVRTQFLNCEMKFIWVFSSYLSHIPKCFPDENAQWDHHTTHTVCPCAGLLRSTDWLLCLPDTQHGVGNENVPVPQMFRLCLSSDHVLNLVCHTCIAEINHSSHIYKGWHTWY